jgi:hypothetical protein
MNELVKSNAAIAPIANMSEFLSLAQEFEKSGMFGCTQPGQGAVLLSTCMTDRISPIEFIRTYHLIEGKPSMRADAMLAKFVQQGGRYKILEFSENKAAGVFSLGDNEVTMSMTMQEAEAAGLTKSKAGKVKDNWRSFPRQMLWARVVSTAIRLVAPQIVAGIYTPEEVQDFDSKPIDTQAIRVEGVDVTLPGVPQQAAEEPQQQETARPDLLPDDAAETGNADANICPCGTVKGKAWKELDTGVLNTVLHSQHPAVKASMTSAHYIALKEELRSRGMG